MCIPEVTDISAAVAAWHWSGHEDITHVQGQRSPRKMVVTGAVAAQCWSDSLEILHAPDQISPVRWWRLSDFEELPHIQGQRSSPSIRIRGEFRFRIKRLKSHSCQRCSEGSNKPCVHQDLDNPQRLRQNCV